MKDIKEDDDNNIFKLFIFLILFIFFIFSNISTYEYEEKKEIKEYNDFNYSGLIENLDIKCGERILHSLKDGTYYCNIYPIDFSIGNIKISSIKNPHNAIIKLAGKEIIDKFPKKRILNDSNRTITIFKIVDRDNNKTNGIYINNNIKKEINKIIITKKNIKNISKKNWNNLMKELSKPLKSDL